MFYYLFILLHVLGWAQFLDHMVLSKEKRNTGLALFFMFLIALDLIVSMFFPVFVWFVVVNIMILRMQLKYS